MPVILITGLPGHGKTLLTVSKISERFKDRDVYYHNIKELQLPWLPIPDPEKWYELPHGAVIVIDECQDIFPTRSGKEQVPEKCKRFEVHRHQGHDIVLITQKPRQLDIHVRQLVGEHIHIERKLGAQKAITYTWPKVCEDVDDTQQRSLSEKGFFNYPKEAFSLYKSAEVHTVKRHIPWPILAIPVAIAVVVFLVWRAYSVLNLGKNTAPAETTSILPTVSAPLPSPTVQKAQDLGYIAARVPELPDFPHTAPVYKELTKPVSAPYPAACVMSQSQGCTCYTQQATKMIVSDDVCRQIVKQGFFMDWKQPELADRGGGISQPSAAGG